MAYERSKHGGAASTRLRSKPVVLPAALVSSEDQNPCLTCRIDEGCPNWLRRGADRDVSWACANAVAIALERQRR